MCSERRRNHGCGQKKPKSTSSAIFGVEAAAKSCELERCADRVRNRTDKANLNFSPELYQHNWVNLSLLVLLQRRSTCDFAPKTWDSTQGYIQCMPLHIGDPVVRTDGRTYGGRDGRSRGYYVTTKISWLDRFYQISLAMVLRWRASSAIR